MKQPYIVGYDVTNRVTGKTKRFKTSKGATDYMDRTDNAYGSYITTRKAIWSDDNA